MDTGQRRACSGAAERVFLTGLLLATISTVAVAQQETAAELRAEIAALRADLEARIAVLEVRLARLEGERSQPATRAAAEVERSRLRAAAAAAAGLPPAEPESTAPLESTGQTQKPFPPARPRAEPAGRGRNLNRLNPEISVTGDVVGIYSDVSREELDVQEFELDLQAALDPFSRMRLTVAMAEEEVEIEEGYIDYPSLGGGLGLVVGKFRQQLGALNRQHLHALPQSEYPLALTTLFGEEVLAQTGISLRWLVPWPWASANEITLEVTDGAADFFAGESFEQLAVLSHVKNFWDVGPATYFEWGLTGTVGETAESGTARAWGTDFTLHWQPPERAKYRELTWRTELFLSQRDDLDGRRQDAWGGYSYLEGLLRRNLTAGLRFDRVEDPFDPSVRKWGLVPYLTWWQSEFVRLRGELQHVEGDRGEEEETRFVLQVTWAAGPHKHENY